MDRATVPARAEPVGARERGRDQGRGDPGHRLAWALTDLAAFTRLLRGEHRRGADADKALAGLRSILAGREPSPYGAHAS
jgi:hypothetical protein